MKRNLLLTAFLIFIVLGYFYYQFVKVLPEDIKRYHEYIEKNQKKDTSKSGLTATTHIRQGVEKDLWYQKGKERLQWHIQAADSALLLIPHNHQLVLEEKLYDLSCMIQESLTETTQTIRYLQADEGTYFYNDHRFNADKVLLKVFEVNGQTLPQSLDYAHSHLKGIAEKVSFYLHNHNVSFKADKFKAEMTPEKDPSKNRN